MKRRKRKKEKAYYLAEGMKGADFHSAGMGVELKHLQLNKNINFSHKVRWFLKHLERMRRWKGLRVRFTIVKGKRD